MINIDVFEVKKKIETKEEMVIVDVRTPEELDRGRIENSINIPLDSFEKDIAGKIPDKNKNVYLYCLSGARSSMAGQIMDQMGYKNVFNIASGLLAWRNKGYPLVTS